MPHPTPSPPLPQKLCDLMFELILILYLIQNQDTFDLIFEPILILYLIHFDPLTPVKITCLLSPLPFLTGQSTIPSTLDKQINHSFRDEWDPKKFCCHRHTDAFIAQLHSLWLLQQAGPGWLVELQGVQRQQAKCCRDVVVSMSTV